MSTYVNAFLVVAEIGFQALLLWISVQALLMVIVLPLWVGLYRAIRPRLRMRRRLPMMLAWAQGILAWGIVAVSATVQRRRVRVPGLRILLTLNAALVALIGTLVRPDLQMILWLGAGLSCVVIVARSPCKTSLGADWMYPSQQHKE